MVNPLKFQTYASLFAFILHIIQATPEILTEAKDKSFYHFVRDLMNEGKTQNHAHSIVSAENLQLFREISKTLAKIKLEKDAKGHVTKIVYPSHGKNPRINEIMSLITEKNQEYVDSVKLTPSFKILIDHLNLKTHSNNTNETVAIGLIQCHFMLPILQSWINLVEIYGKRFPDNGEWEKFFVEFKLNEMTNLKEDLESELQKYGVLKSFLSADSKDEEFRKKMMWSKQNVVWFSEH